ncbi:putative S-adenosylmethionine-dependent methyltransferase [Clostridium tepidiprofundi DSM 19306]|uniref:Putative S-adenosylmethionine-dependent methyltransferase n=1 Tax=Clostridium tepidiprofundi DSM 19306 TaxID=1121338 RepID=A0A151B3J5_9CLOT|nr:glycosyltransferase [Clostridium tepidiprofundi]KYH34466.1 putative S-adenosylmethionine-dependent methyltransferase [Clostridium tepidiprofundi DSM 19306]
MEFTGERFIPDDKNNSEIAIEHIQRYRAILDVVKDKVVLDAASGEGYGSYILSQKAKFIYGIDISEEAIINANLKYKKENVKFIRNSIEKIELQDKSIDVVVSFETIEHVNEKTQEKFLQEIKRILKDDGVLIISTPNKKIYSDNANYKNEYHIKEFYYEEFYRFLREFFEYVEFYVQGKQIVNVLRNTASSKNEVYNLIKMNDFLYVEDKYIVAICSNKEIKQLNLNSIVIDNENNYEKIMRRIVELQDEIQEKNRWAFSLDKEIENKNTLINTQNKRIEELSNWGNKLDNILQIKEEVINKQNINIKQLNELIEKLKRETEQKEKLLSDQNDIIKQQNEMFKELENELKEREKISTIQKKRIEELLNGKDTLENNLRIKEEIIEKQNSNINQISDILKELDCKLKERDKIINIQNKKIDELTSTIKKIDDKLNEKKKLINDKDNKIEDLNNELNKLKLELDEKDQSLKQNKICARELNDSINLLKLTINHKDKEIYDMNDRIIDLSKKSDKFEEIFNELEDIKRDLNHTIELKDKLEDQKNDLLNELNRYKNEIKEKEQQILNHKGHIEQLLQQERVLMGIYESEGWKILLRLYKLRDFLLPPHSKRRLIAKLLRRPKKVIKHINLKSIGKFLKHINEDGQELETRINKYISEREPVDCQTLEIFEDVQGEYNKLFFENSKKPLVSIIIPVYNQFEYTYSCLKSILENTKGIQYEIIIADDVSTDETKCLKNYVENIIIIRNKKNLGFLLNCNNAAEKVRGKYIMFLNNDTNVQKDWLKYLVELIESDEDIGMVGSKLVYPDGKLQEAGGIIWNDASGWNYGRMDDAEKSEYNYVREVDYISGAAIMIKKDLWKRIGGFDTRYAPAYCEDSDLAFEVRAQGYKVMYQPKSIVVHFEGVSNGTDVSTGIKKYQVENNKKFYLKWEKELKKEHFNNGENVFIARDRSRNKKTILVIDHYVPNFDKDAGSRTTYHYLKMFLSMGFNVKFIGDNFYRQEPYTTILQQMGIEVLYGYWYSTNYKKWIKENCSFIDYVYLNRPHISIKYIDFLRENTSAKIIYYGHDLHFLREKREYELTGNKELLASSEHWKKVELQLMRKSDITYYPSQCEIDEIHSIDPNINAKAIPAYIFENTKFKNIIPFSNRRDLLFVGGFGHKPNIDGVLWFIRKIFPLVKEEIEDVKFYIVGSNPPQEVLDLRSDEIIVTGFVTDEQLNEYYDKCKLVVVPLRYGAGVKGKVVEALYKQIPIITTSVGAEGLEKIDEYLEISDDPLEFSKKIIEYYNNIEKLNYLAQKSINYIEKYFSESSVMAIISEDIR